MHELHFLDYAAIGLYFLALLWIGFRVMRQGREGNESESFICFLPMLSPAC